MDADLLHEQCDVSTFPDAAMGLGRVKTNFGRPDAFELRQDRPQKPLSEL